MKFSHTVLTGLLMLAPTLPVLADAPVATGCEAKRQSIEQQLHIARANGNDARAAGLENALSEVKVHCTDDGLRADREADLRKKALKVKEREQELAEAQTDGRPEKISKKQQKLDEARAELDEARLKLTQ